MKNLLFTSLLAFSLTLVAEQDRTQPTPAANATWGDWSKICNDDGSTCQIVQNANQNETGKLVFQTAIGYVKDNDRPILFLTGPLGIYIPKGIAIFVDENEQGKQAAIQRCDAKGCLALLALEQEFLDSLLRGKTAKVVFAASSTQNVQLPVSLDGITAAFQQLQQ